MNSGHWQRHLTTFCGIVENDSVPIEDRQLPLFQELHGFSRWLSSNLDCTFSILTPELQHYFFSAIDERVYLISKVTSEGDGRIRFLASEEEQSLIEVLKRDWPNYVSVFIVSVNTGVRASEQWRAEWIDVDFERRIFTLRDTKNGEPVRRVPMNSLAVAAFQELRKGHKKAALFF